MKKTYLFGIIVVSLLLVVLSAVSSQDSELPAWEDLEDGWNTLMPGGDTTCAYGTEYSFHARPADSDNLLIFFNGGGACWFGQICDPASPTFVPLADLPANNPAENPGGIFDFENENNPFTDYNMVFVSYCTGDVHLGNAVTTYEVPATDDAEAHEITINHKGNVNAMTVLDWVFDNIESPDTVFVTGSSAGSIASPFYAGIVAEEYPDSRIVQLGDGSGGYHVPETIPVVNSVWGVINIIPDWEEYEDVTEDNLTFERYYVESASRHPDITFAQYNTANDETQYQFLYILGIVDVPLMDLIEANFEEIYDGVENFHSAMAGGTLHTILRFPEFYTYDIDGVMIYDWVDDLSDGEMVEDLMCTDCENPPVESDESD